MCLVHHHQKQYVHSSFSSIHYKCLRSSIKVLQHCSSISWYLSDHSFIMYQKLKTRLTVFILPINVIVNRFKRQICDSFFWIIQNTFILDAAVSASKISLLSTNWPSRYIQYISTSCMLLKCPFWIWFVVSLCSRMLRTEGNTIDIASYLRMSLQCSWKEKHSMITY